MKPMMHAMMGLVVGSAVTAGAVLVTGVVFVVSQGTALFGGALDPITGGVAIALGTVALRAARRPSETADA